jgi:hypothetical protein
MAYARKVDAGWNTKKTKKLHIYTLTEHISIWKQQKESYTSILMHISMKELRYFLSATRWQEFDYNTILQLFM